MKIKFIYILLLPVLFCIGSCKNNSYQVADSVNSGPKTDLPVIDRITPAFDSLKKAASMIEDGDLVCRAGTDIISFSIANFSMQDKEYSHSGIAFKEDGQIYIYHVYAGAENPDAVVMRQPLDSFCNPHIEKGYGVFRYNMNPSERAALHEILKKHFIEKMKFDKLFDLKTDDTQYCAEMISKSLRKATAGRLLIPETTIRNKHIRDPGFNDVYVKEFNYIAVDNLFLNNFTHVLQRVKF